MKRMLFNATQAEESRVAIVDGQKLINLDIETFGKEQRKGNIYKGIITKVEPSLEACFVDYGTDRHGFLPFKEIHRSYYQNHGGGRTKIQEMINEGDEVLVQIEKDERGNKGAALTTYVSLAGRYLVVMPNNPKGGVSRRIEGDERTEIKNVINQLNIPKGMGVIARTAGIGRSVEELQWDLDYQLKLWDAVLEASRQENVQSLILQESALVIRAIRDHFQPDIGEILIDNQEVYNKVYQFISFVMPQNLSKVKLYQDHIPLFSRFQIENQIDSVYARQVSLPSGGEIVIDHTEALVSIDVNSAKATKGSDVEETALQTNLEAAEEISRQMRLRDIGGLVVIDFIDMEESKNQREVEATMRDFLKEDRARVQITRLSRFGLMEISRQRLQVSLGESTHMTCPRCSGTGVIRGVQSSAIHILRVIQEKAMKENTGEVQAQLPIDVATFLLNEKREQIFSLEERLGVPIIIIPNKNMEIPHYSVERIKVDDVIEGVPSYSMVEEPEQNAYESNTQKSKEIEQIQAAVQGVNPSVPAPKHVKAKKSLFAGFSDWLSRFFESEEENKGSTDNNDENSFRRHSNSRDVMANNRRGRSSRSTQSKNKNNNDSGNSGYTRKQNTEDKKIESSSANSRNNNTNNRNKSNDKKNNARQSKNTHQNINAEKDSSGDVALRDINKQEMKTNSKKVSNKQEAKNKVDVVANKDKSQDKPIVVSLSGVSNTLSSDGGNQSSARNTKNNRKNNTRKNNHRYRIPTASYLENKIHIGRLTRYIQRTTVDVLKKEGFIIPTVIEDNKQSLIQSQYSQQSETLDVVLMQNPVEDLASEIIISFAETDKKGSDLGNVSFDSELILVETNQSLLQEEQDFSEKANTRRELRRNDVKLIEQQDDELSVDEMQQVETKSIE